MRHLAFLLYKLIGLDVNFFFSLVGLEFACYPSVCKLDAIVELLLPPLKKWTMKALNFNYIVFCVWDIGTFLMLICLLERTIHTQLLCSYLNCPKWEGEDRFSLSTIEFKQLETNDIEICFSLKSFLSILCLILHGFRYPDFLLTIL